MTSKCNEHKIWFPRYENGNIDIKMGKYDIDNQLKKATLKYEREGILCSGVANIEVKLGMITDNCFTVLD